MDEYKFGSTTPESEKPRGPRLIIILAFGCFALMTFCFLAFILHKVGLLLPMLIASRDLMIGRFGLLIIGFYVAYAIVSYTSSRRRAAVAGTLIAIGLLSIRLGIVTYLNGGKIFNADFSLAIPSLEMSNMDIPKPNISIGEAFSQYIGNTEAGKITSEPNEGTTTYELIREMIRNGIYPPEKEVRVEDLLNHFSYNYATESTQPFSITFEAAPSIFNEDHYLLHVGLRARTVEKRGAQSSNQILLLDLSALRTNKNSLNLLQRGLNSFIDSMKADDTLSLVAFEGSEECILPSVRGDKKAILKEAIASLATDPVLFNLDGKDIALSEAEMLRKQKAPTYISFITDSNINYTLSRLKNSDNILEENKYAGLYILPFGSKHRFNAHNADELANLLKNDIPNEPEEVARNIKIEVEFNSSYIRQHNLVGYYDKSVTREYSGHDVLEQKYLDSGKSLTFLDEIELTTNPFSSANPITIGILKVSAILGKDSFPSEYSFPITSTNIKRSKYEASDDYRFSAAVAGYGVLLRNSPQKGDLQWNEIKNLARGSLGSDPDGSRHDFLQLVNTAADLLPQ